MMREEFLTNLQQDLDEMSDSTMMITVRREDLEDLIKAYKRLKDEKDDLESDVYKLRRENEMMEEGEY